MISASAFRWALAGLILCLTFPCRAQTSSVGSAPIELIVRTEQPRSTLAQQFRTSSPAQQTSDSRRFPGVESSTAVFSGLEGQVSPTGGSSESVFRLTVRDSTALERLLETLQARPDVEYAHPNVTFSVTGEGSRLDRSTDDPPVLAPTNPLADSLDHLGVVQALEAWSTTIGRDDVQIGIVDTGIYLRHPDLQDQLWVNEAEDLNGNGRLDASDLNGVDDDGNGYVDDVVGYDFVDRPRTIPSGDYEDRDPDPRPDPSGPGSGHGTAVAGVAASAPGAPSIGVAGVAPGVSIVPIRAFGADGRGQADDIAAAIAYGATLGVDVLNLSFGRADPVPVIEDAIEYANERGTIVVAAAGNELTDAPHYPSDYPDVLSVAWLAEDGEGLPDFNQSQYGIGIDLGAPGSNVFTTQYPREAVATDEEPSRDALYGPSSGSSFSAPQVAGAAALLRSADSSLSTASVRSILTTTAADLTAENWDVRTGAGRLDLRAALSRAYPARTQISFPEHNSGTRGQSPVVIRGSAIAPSFQHYALYYAEGTRNLDTRPDPWRTIQPPTSAQQLRDTLGVWDTPLLSEGEYTLRLVTRLQDGSTVEDRRRVYVDNTAPSLDVRFLGAGRVRAEHGIIADVRTDDPTRLELVTRQNGRRDSVRSETVVRRHGLAWPDASGRGGTVRVSLVATNPSGLSTSVDTTLTLPPDRENTALLQRTSTEVPRGYLLSESTDFDADGLPEVVLNQDRGIGGISDSLRSFEWSGEGFSPADTLLARLFPRDVGDTNQDGRRELLLQIQGASLLLEQSSSGGMPKELAFADTVREAGEPAFRAALLANLDGDAAGEIVGATDSTQWRIFERTPEGAREVLRLNNPTGTTGRDSNDVANVFGSPQAAAADFDGDGATDLLTGDRDGDLIVYEATGDDAMEVAWTHETDRVDAGERFGTGDVTGNGRPEFVTMTTSSPKTLDDGERAPPISYYSIWAGQGDDAYNRLYRLPISGPFIDQGAIELGDLDGDARDEVVVAHPPSLLVLDRRPDGTWRVLHESEASPSVLTPKMVVDDFSGDGRASIIAAADAPQLVRYQVTDGVVQHPPPRWTDARPLGPDTTRLAWRAPQADSVQIYTGAPEGDLDPVRATTDSMILLPGSASQRVALRAWREGEVSPLSPSRVVRPHLPARVTEVQYPDPTAVALRFSEPLAPDPRPAQFSFGSSAAQPKRVLVTNNGTGLVLRFGDGVAGASGPLSWRGVRDETGLLVDQTSTQVAFPAPDRGGLFVQSATILDQRRVRLEFNEAVPAAEATASSRYRLQPRGRVEEVRMEEGSDRAVILRVDDLVVGATGQEASLRVTELTSMAGRRLSAEGHTVRLTRPADNLENVFIYPNPHRSRQHSPEVTIAGLPPEATVRIYSTDGRLVDEFSVSNNDSGGTTWDLQDRRGRRVPSGLYLVRVAAPEQSAVMKKVAVIR